MILRKTLRSLVFVMVVSVSSVVFAEPENSPRPYAGNGKTEYNQQETNRYFRMKQNPDTRQMKRMENVDEQSNNHQRQYLRRNRKSAFGNYGTTENKTGSEQANAWSNKNNRFHKKNHVLDNSFKPENPVNSNNNLHHKNQKQQFFPLQNNNENNFYNKKQTQNYNMEKERYSENKINNRNNNFQNNEHKINGRKERMRNGQYPNQTRNQKHETRTGECNRTHMRKR